MGVPKPWSPCSLAIANWEFELLGAEQTLGEEQGSLCKGQCRSAQPVWDLLPAP